MRKIVSIQWRDRIRMKSEKGQSALILMLILFLSSANSLYAYIDPGTGSYILQMLIAGILGAAFAVKIFWNHIRTFFVKLFKKGDAE